jgi:hypothetical protein
MHQSQRSSLTFFAVPSQIRFRRRPDWDLNRSLGGPGPNSLYGASTPRYATLTLRWVGMYSRGPIHQFIDTPSKLSSNEWDQPELNGVCQTPPSQHRQNNRILHVSAPTTQEPSSHPDVRGLPTPSSNTDIDTERPIATLTKLLYLRDV